MRSGDIIEEMMTKVKSNLQNHVDQLNSELTVVANVAIVTKCLVIAVIKAVLAGFKTYIQENEICENTIVANNQNYPV